MGTTEEQNPLPVTRVLITVRVGDELVATDFTEPHEIDEVLAASEPLGDYLQSLGEIARTRIGRRAAPPVTAASSEPIPIAPAAMAPAAETTPTPTPTAAGEDPEPKRCEPDKHELVGKGNMLRCRVCGYCTATTNRPRGCPRCEQPWSECHCYNGAQ